MAGTRKLVPVLHSSEKKFRSVYELGNRLLIKGLYVDPITFEHPVIAKVDFKINFDLFAGYITTARKNSDHKLLRDRYCKIVFGQIKELLEYVKPICAGDIDIIIKSGFDSNRQPEKHAAPEQPVIEKVVPGKNEGTYKIFVQLKRNKTGVDQDPTTHDKSVKYCAEITTTPDIEDSWSVIIPNASILKLIFSKFTPLVKNYIRVYGINASGAGQKSAAFMFLPM
jgi:hypothetical protein